jgi:hypothetical protein
MHSAAGTFRDTFNRFWIEANTSNNHNRATGQLRIEGTGGTVVPKNAIATVNGNRWVLTSEAVISTATGSVTVGAQAGEVSAGPSGNISSGVVMTLVDPIDGASTIVSATEFTGGSFLFSSGVVMYFRNFVCAQGYTLPEVPEDDTTWFVRPVG